MPVIEQYRIDADLVKRNTDILAVVGAVVDLTQHGRRWVGCCPFHAEKTPSFDVTPDKGLWGCFGCGKHGDVISFVEEYYHVTFHRAVEIITGTRMDTNPDTTATRRAPMPSPTLKDSREWRKQLDGLQPYAGSPAEAYLRGRGIDAADLVTAMGARFHPAWGGKAAAIVFPIRDQAGQLVAAEARFLDPNRKPKNHSAGPKSTGVYSTPGAFTGPEIIIVESAINALSLAVCGFPAVATNGAEIHPKWLPGACKGKRVLIGLDADSAGAKGMQALCDNLAAVGIPSYELPLTREGFDWNDCLREYGGDRMTTALMAAIKPTPLTALPTSVGAVLSIGGSIRAESGAWCGHITALHPPDGDFPAGWAEVLTSDQQRGEADIHGLCDMNGKALYNT